MKAVNALILISISESQSKDFGRSECVELYVPSDEALFGPQSVAMAPEVINMVCCYLYVE